MRSITDVFIKHPVLAVVVNIVLVLVGWRAITALPIQQYPQLESSSIVINTTYYGAAAETVRGFLTTPIERAVSAIGGVDHIESTSRAGSEHGHDPSQAELQQHRRSRRGDGPPAAGALGTAAASRSTGR